MLQMSHGDDAFGLVMNLLKLVKKSGELMQNIFYVCLHGIVLN